MNPGIPSIERALPNDQWHLSRVLSNGLFPDRVDHLLPQLENENADSPADHYSDFM
jgi:hypothetical protein